MLVQLADVGLHFRCVFAALPVRVVLALTGHVRAGVDIDVQVARVDVIPGTPLRMEFVGQHFPLRFLYHIVVDQERDVSVQSINANVQDVRQQMLMAALNPMIYEVFLFKQPFATFFAQGVVLLQNVWQLKHVFNEIVLLPQHFLQLFAGALVGVHQLFVKELAEKVD